jgi:hypothetical protein
MHSGSHDGTARQTANPKRSDAASKTLSVDESRDLLTDKF